MTQGEAATPGAPEWWLLKQPLLNQGCVPDFIWLLTVLCVGERASQKW